MQNEENEKDAQGGIDVVFVFPISQPKYLEKFKILINILNTKLFVIAMTVNKTKIGIQP